MAKGKKPDGAVDETSFEDSLERLQAIVEELEGGEVPLERALELFEEGVGLGRRCGARLGAAEKRISVLVERADGTLAEQDFDEEAAEDPPPAPRGRAPRAAQKPKGTTPLDQGDIPF